MLQEILQVMDSQSKFYSFDFTNLSLFPRSYLVSGLSFVLNPFGLSLSDCQRKLARDTKLNNISLYHGESDHFDASDPGEIKIYLSSDNFDKKAFNLSVYLLFHQITNKTFYGVEDIRTEILSMNL